MTPTRYLAARLWDGLGSLVHRGAVDVVDGTITAVGRADRLPPSPPGAVIRDLGDVTLLPGLIDTHVHVTFSTGTDVVADFERDRSVEGGGPLLAHAQRNLGIALDVGTTTVRDLGTPAPIATAIRAAVADGTLRGPDVITSASPLTTPGGHCHFLSHEVGPDEDPAAAVDRAVEAGADLIKVFASGGNLTPHSSPLARQFDRAALQAIVGAAHRRGLIVAAHAFGHDSVVDCAAVGVDTIEHCAFLTPAGPVVDAETLVRMAGDGIIAVPTVASGPPPPDSFDPTTVPLAIREKIEALMRLFPLARDAIRAMVEAGVELTAGTDAGIPKRPFDSLTASVAWFGSAEGLGMSTAEALATATPSRRGPAAWRTAAPCALDCGPTCWPWTATRSPRWPTSHAPAWSSSKERRW
ncbi:MAG TPA: amidohydrolase family protein [Egibacteraceae bacterium]|jgi:imidazolonepropionase-like amidohydrolase|nr:amidohydrolase family protein [Egibacteraceae bacterium]